MKAISNRFWVPGITLSPCSAFSLKCSCLRAGRILGPRRPRHADICQFRIWVASFADKELSGARSVPRKFSAAGFSSRLFQSVRPSASPAGPITRSWMGAPATRPRLSKSQGTHNPRTRAPLKQSARNWLNPHAEVTRRGIESAKDPVLNASFFILTGPTNCESLAWSTNHSTCATFSLPYQRRSPNPTKADITAGGQTYFRPGGSHVCRRR